jgi:Glycosyl transferase family 2
VIRRHRPFLVLLALGVLLRVLVMIGYRPAIFYIDSFASYLSVLTTLDPTGEDPIGYVVYLLRPTLAIGNFTLLVTVQHLLGIGMAVAGYLLLRRKGAGRWLAALAVAPVLLDGYQAQIEHNVMADPLFEALLVAALVTLAWPDRPGWVGVVVAGLLLGLSATVRQVGEVMIVPVVLYLLVAGGRWWRRAAFAGAAVLAFAVPVAGYATYYHGFTGTYALSKVTGDALYGRVAGFVDCAGLALPDEERILCPAEPRGQRYGPEFYAHDEHSPIFALQKRIGDRAYEVARDFAMRAIRHQPVDFAAAVGADGVKVLSWARVDFTPEDPSIERWRYQTEFPTYPDLITLGSITNMARNYGDPDPRMVPWIGAVLRGYQLTVGYTPGPVLALAAILALVGGWRRREAWLFLAAGAAVLLGADVAEFSWRYQLPGYLLLPLAGALGLVGLRRPAPAPFPEPPDEAALAGIDPELTFPPVVVLIAAYNEEDGLGPVLDSVPATCCGLNVATLVVVDGATDGTADVARAHGAVTCVVPVNRGQGAALRLGYHLAAQRGATYLVTTDADGQYDLAELPRLLEPLIAGEADFVTGSRELGANESTDPVRRLGTRFFAGLVSLLTRQRITDTSFGFRAMRAEIPATVTLTQPQYQSSELLIGVLSQGYRVVERPMTMRRRAQGRSKKGGNLIYGWRYARVVLGTWWRERKTTRSRTRNLTRNSAA